MSGRIVCCFRTDLHSADVVGDGVAAVVSVWGFTTAGTFNSVVPHFICLSHFKLYYVCKYIIVLVLKFLSCDRFIFTSN